MIGGRTTAIEVMDNESNSWKNYPMTVPAILNSFEVENIDENVYLFGGYGFLEQEYSGIWSNLDLIWVWWRPGYILLDGLNLGLPGKSGRPSS